MCASVTNRIHGSKKKRRKKKLTPLQKLNLLPDRSRPTDLQVRRTPKPNPSHSSIKIPKPPPTIRKTLYAVHEEDGITLTAKFERRSGFWHCITPPPTHKWWGRSDILSIRNFLFSGGFQVKWADDNGLQLSPDRHICSGVATPAPDASGIGSVKVCLADQYQGGQVTAT